MTDLSSGLIGLSILSGSNSYASLASSLTSVDTPAVMKAKAAFTTPATVAPWQSSTPIANANFTQIQQIELARSVIDTSSTPAIAALPDVQTSFTIYKALDKLRLLAQQAAKAGTTANDRKTLEAAFSKGLQDLQSYMGTASTDKLQLAFNQPVRQVQSIGVPATASTTRVGKPVSDSRTGPMSTITGNETLRISLTKQGKTSVVDVDLSTITSANGGTPPSLQQVADAINAKIAANNPPLDINGNPLTNSSGRALSPFLSKVGVKQVSVDDGWALTFDGAGIEDISIDQVNTAAAPVGNALMVVTGQTQLTTSSSGDSTQSTTMKVMTVGNLDDPNGAYTRNTLSAVGGIDEAATAQSQATIDAAAAQAAAAGIKPENIPQQDPTVYASTKTNGIVTDAQGYSYIVGTTSGQVGSHLADGQDDLFLTKMDSLGNIVWQRSLGQQGTATGMAVTLAGNGDIVVAGSVTGANGKSTDSDMLVARFSSAGDEAFATTIGGLSDETANAVTVGQDGSIYVAGRTSSGGGDGYVARLDSTGKVLQRQTLNYTSANDLVTSLATDSDGNLLMLTKENGESKVHKLDGTDLSSELGSVSLGNVDARVLAVSSTGEIAVAGAASSAVTGAATNTMSGGADGFVTRLDANLANASTTYVGSSGTDQIDSLVFMGGDIYVGGRTTGDLNGAVRGKVDGFISRLDSNTGAIKSTSQFGTSGITTEPVRIAAAPGGDGDMSKFGLNRGSQNPVTSTLLTSQTNLKAGDNFSISVDGGTARTITIEAGDTMDSLADKIRKIVGTKATVSTTTSGGLETLRIMGKAGDSFQLFAGTNGADALAKLGLAPTKIDIPQPKSADAPKVTPGGSYGLSLNTTLNLSSSKSAQAAVTAVNSAISMIQTAYRSLYWSSSDAQIVNGATGSGSAYQQAQLANYQAGLARLTGASA